MPRRRGLDSSHGSSTPAVAVKQVPEEGERQETKAETVLGWAKPCWDAGCFRWEAQRSSELPSPSAVDGDTGEGPEGGSREALARSKCQGPKPKKKRRKKPREAGSAPAEAPLPGAGESACELACADASQDGAAATAKEAAAKEAVVKEEEEVPTGAQDEARLPVRFAFPPSGQRVLFVQMPELSFALGEEDTVLLEAEA